MRFNKGEWSELYTFLYLMENPNLNIVDEKLKVVDENTFKILEIILNENSYKIHDDVVIKTLNNNLVKKYNITYISKEKRVLLQKIQSHTKAKGSFNILEVETLINDLLDGKKFKGSSNVKGDLNANVSDNKYNRVVNLSYNIKSNLGSSATLLNASNNTNFIYEITNIDDDIMNYNNSINGRKKLLDRCQFLNDNKFKINFISTEKNVFGYNLKLIDSNLDKILAEMLYLSYSKNEKDIQKLLLLISKDEDEQKFYMKKMSDFTNAVTFGMKAGQKWNGINEVNGGILLVNKVGKVYLLDLVYYSEIVNKYLIDNIKLDSPSSSRYKMFDIYKENNKYYFKLNLQIRFK